MTVLLQSQQLTATPLERRKIQRNERREILDLAEKIEDQSLSEKR
ncbi:MAG: hypothetical protein AB2687_17935 [Candidatus Thiodiazotropha taylori]